jgi:hypothetical protein
VKAPTNTSCDRRRGRGHSGAGRRRRVPRAGERINAFELPLDGLRQREGLLPRALDAERGGHVGPDVRAGEHRSSGVRGTS